jgi:hypothetical protein
MTDARASHFPLGRMIAAVLMFGFLVLMAAVPPSRADSQARASAVDLLPDPVQIAPTEISLGNVTRKVRKRGGGYTYRTYTLLAFSSLIVNMGQGPLISQGVRSNMRSHMMRGDQLIKRDDGSTRRVKNVAKIHWSTSSDHSHWHQVGFDRFALKKFDGTVLKRAAKQGFCIGDRAKADLTLPGAPQTPKYTGHCQMNKPKAKRVISGFSVGWGDDYPPFLEGQSINVTGFAAGTYCLEHRVTGKYTEVSKANNIGAAIVTIDPLAQPPALTVHKSIDFRDTPAPSCQAAAALAGF